MKPTRTLIEVPISHPRGLAATTWEQRRRLSAAELIQLMGPLHVNHPDFKQRAAPSLIKMENLAGRQPVFDDTEPGLWGCIKQLLRWFAQ